MQKTVIDAVYTVVRKRAQGAVRTIKLSTLRNSVVRKGIIASNETITRALRQLRDEGTVDYTYDATKGTYFVHFSF